MHPIDQQKEASDKVFNLNLYDKPKDQQFTKEEMDLLKLAFPKSKFLVKYAIWKQERRNGLYVTFIIDNFPKRGRPCAADRAWDVICTRQLTDIEWEEELANFGCNNRVMHQWNYRIVEGLIKEDKELYGVETPQKFVDECRKRGYGMKISKVKPTVKP